MRKTVASIYHAQYIAGDYRGGRGDKPGEHPMGFDSELSVTKPGGQSGGFYIRE